MKIARAVSVVALTLAATSAFANVDRHGRQSYIADGSSVSSCAQGCHVSGVQGRSAAVVAPGKSAARAVMFSHASVQEIVGRS